jgi:two-component system, OmpR family, response regulator MtrA
LARLGALLRRTANAPHAAARPAGVAPQGQELRVGDLTLDLSHRSATLEGKELHLTRTELRLLTALMRHPDEVLTRQQLIEAVWGDKGAGVGRTIEPHVHRLRAKLNAAASHPPTLLSIRGRGYALTTTPERLLAA